MRYKYQLNHLLSLLPTGIYPETITASIEVLHQIDVQVFHRDRFIGIGDTEEIPDERLRIYADVFGVRVDDLRTKMVASVAD